MSITIKFFDEGDNHPLDVSPSDKLIDVFKKYASSQRVDPSLVTTPGNVTFFKGIKVLSTSKNLLKTVQDIGLDQDSVIRVDWKNKRSYALNETYLDK